MLRKRSHRIILIFIAGELLLLALIFLVQQRPSPGFLASASNAENVSPTNAPATATNTALPIPTDTTTPSTDALITLTLPSPTLPPIPVVSPSATPPPVPTSAPKPVSRIGPQAVSQTSTTRVVIPSIGVDARVVEMGYLIREENGQQITDWQIPENEVGHMIGSVNAGETGNVVLSGHNNIFAAVFRKLYTLKVGDSLTLFNRTGASFVYRVVQSQITQERGVALQQQLANARVLLPTDDARVTLISCWPETNNTHRAIVIAQLVGPAQ